MQISDRRERCIKTVVGLLYKPRNVALTVTLGIALCNALFCASPAFAADYRVQRWQAVEIVLTSSQTYVQPFQDVEVTAAFTGQGDKVITRPAFWDGGRTWKIR